MTLAARLELRAPPVTIAAAEGISFLVIERFDRARTESGILRIHQEDFCQALAIPPERKYQGEGGPSLAQSFLLLDACVRPAPDRLELLRRVLFNYLIGNADAHGKNFALLHGDDGTALAPAYDLVCTTVYRHHTNRMAMKIGGKSRFGVVLPRHWERFAHEAGVAPPRVRRDLLVMAERLATEARLLADELRTASPDGTLSIYDQIARDVDARCGHVRRSFDIS